MPFKGDSDEFQPLFGLKIDGTTNSSSTSLTSGRYSIKTLLSNFNSASLAFSISTGCATWDGIKEDSSSAYDSTKEAIHEATK